LAKITRHKAEYLDGLRPSPEIIDFDGSLGEWIVSEYKNKEIPFLVYEGCVSSANHIPIDENSVDFLLSCNDEYTVIETAAGNPLVVSAIISVVIAVATIALTPDPKVPQNVNRQQESPNNQLGSRTNRPRPFQRLPDIKGEVLSVPDVMMPPYVIYSGGLKQEYAAYVFGRKRLGFDLTTVFIPDQIPVEFPVIKDGNTPIYLINGAAADVYWPSQPVGSPQYSFGDDPIDVPLYIPYRSNQVNGITLESFGESKIISDIRIYGNQNSDGGYIQRVNGSGVFDSTVYQVGQKFELENFFIDNFGTNEDISGEYNIVSLGNNDSRIFFDNPVNFELRKTPLNEINGVPTNWSVSPVDGGTSIRWTDWVYVTDDPSIFIIVFNVLAPNGLYKDTGQATLEEISIEYEFEVESVDSNGSPTGIRATPFTDIISGNSQKQIGKTTQRTTAALGLPRGPFRMRARRITPRETGLGVAVSDEVKLVDVYGLAEAPDSFGDTTWIHVRTLATPTATAIKERQINAVVRERVNKWIDGSTQQGFESDNNNAVQSLIAAALDPREGNLDTTDIDIQGLLDMSDQIESYFPNGDVMNYFSYTFDSTETTFQEMAKIMLNAINAIGYRENGLIKAYFEGLQTDPAMLFTHRSKLPGETYSRKFNDSTVSDGVIFKWQNPETEVQETIILPQFGSPLKPKTFEIPGIRNEIQATVRARREFNKIRYQKESMQFTATAEGRYVRVGEMISVVKGTRTQTQDGEVLDINGLELTLSQDIFFGAGTYFIQLKDSDGSIESIEVTAGPQSNIVTLDSVPVMTIRTGIDSRRTEFSIGNDSRLEAQEWLPQKVDLSNPFQAKIECINYSDEYYEDDGVEYRGFDEGFDEGFGI